MDLTQQKPVAILLTVLAIAGCNGTSSVELNLKPAFVGTIVQASYDGNTDDLLTAAGAWESAPPSCRVRPAGEVRRENPCVRVPP